MKKVTFSVTLIAVLSSCLLSVAATCFACDNRDSDKSLTGVYDDYVPADTFFRAPYIDVDEWRDTPVRHRYIHGGFQSNTTRFSFYLPPEEQYEGRFFQYITPAPESENLAQYATGEYNQIGFSTASGAYFVETNGGGRHDYTKPNAVTDPTIGAYRANAACAEFSRWIVKKLYGGDRPYGYAYGGSGGGYRTVGGMENTTVWDGGVPYVLGSPVAIPNVFAVRMHAMRILKDKFPQIVDALEPGGSGDMYAGLNDEERAALEEVTRMGFPPASWYGYRDMDINAFPVLYQGVMAADRAYFEEDFWNKPGYLGYNPPESLKKARLQKVSKIRAAVNIDKGVELGLIRPIPDEYRGTAENAWRSIEGASGGMPVAFQLADNMPDVGFLGGDMVVLSGEAKGVSLLITKIEGDKVVLGQTNALDILAKIKPGDEVRVDNSNFLAAQTYHRHQYPGKEYYVWEQFLDSAGEPLYPQRPLLLGPIFTRSAAGCLPVGKFSGKMILCCSLMDCEAFPWQGDWYRSRVKEYLGDKTDDHFRLWYTEHALHGDNAVQLGTPTHAVNYIGVLQQALRDVSAWVEKGIAPAQTTRYKIADGQVVTPPSADERKGIQPVVNASIDGKKRADISAGESVTFHVVVEIPQGTGRLVQAEWDIDGTGQYAHAVNLSEAEVSGNGCLVEFTSTYTFDRPGTYFPTVRVASERNGDVTALYARIRNLDRVRVVVK